jgi:hypothetical protein
VRVTSAICERSHQRLRLSWRRIARRALAANLLGIDLAKAAL